MNIKQILVTSCLLLLLCPCAAFAEEEPIIYTVKEGDTLWDISHRFIKDPYYWPNLWSHNPDIGNPHLIYPGQKLRIYDGRIEIIPIDEKTGEKIDASITPDELVIMSTFGGARSFISNADLDILGTLVDTVDNRIMISEHDTVFLKMLDLSAVQAGDHYELISIGDPVKHPITGAAIGYQVRQSGTLTITEVTPTVAVGLVTDAQFEIERGARVRPYIELPNRITRKLANRVMEGYIVSADENKNALGQWDVIQIDIGAEEGLQIGHELDLNRRREATKAALEQGETLQLPDIDLGDAIVLEVHPNYSEAVIIRTGNLPLYRGDHVATKTAR